MLRVYQAENTKPLLGSEESVMAGDLVEVSQNEKKDSLDKTIIGSRLAAVHYQSP